MAAGEKSRNSRQGELNKSCTSRSRISNIGHVEGQLKDCRAQTILGYPGLQSKPDPYNTGATTLVPIGHLDAGCAPKTES